MRLAFVTICILPLLGLPAFAQPMGPEMGMGMGMGMGPGMGMGMQQGFVDIKPVWSPDGKWIAFSRVGQGQQEPAQGVRGGLVPVQNGKPGEVKWIGYNVSPLAWSSDSSQLVCGIAAGTSGQSMYGGFWRGAADGSGLKLLAPAKAPKIAVYSPDGTRLLMVDERAKDHHEILVGSGDENPKIICVVRDGERYIGCG